jgi:menaquinone-dependent protoporphyrinogen oxidase
MTASALDVSAAAPVLFVHASRFGQGVKVAQAMAQTLAERGWASQAMPVREALERDLSAHRALVLVASIRYGHFAADVARLVRQQHAALQAATSVFVSINLTARKPDKRSPQSNVYTRKFLAFAARQGWQPTLCEVLAGALRYPRYGWLDKRMIQLIMRITGGETDTSRDIEYTDWAEVQALAERLAQHLHASAPAQPSGAAWAGQARRVGCPAA